MNVSDINDRLARVVSLVESWQAQDVVPAIERDMALEELRRVYEQILAIGNVDSVMPKQVAEQTTSAATAIVAVDDEEALDIDALLGLTDDIATTNESKDGAAEQPASASDEEPVEEPVVETDVVEQEPEPKPIAEPAEDVVDAEEPVSEVERVEPKAETPAVVVASGGLFDIEDIPVRSKSGRKMLSLYDTPVVKNTDSAAVAVATETVGSTATTVAEVVTPTTVESQPRTVEAKREPQPQPQPTRLADVLGGKTVLADKMVDDTAPIAAVNRITDLRKAIGLNDRFLLIRDLFDGNAARYEDTITTLNEFDDLDECMIYIVENFAWNPNLEGAKLLVSLIERKLS